MDDSDKYQKFEGPEHIRKKPGMWIGSIKNNTDYRWVINNEGNDDDDNHSVSSLAVERKEITFNPGLERCVLELIINAVDHAQRMKDSKNPVTKIEVECDKHSFTIKNNGQGIPVKKHTEHKIYIPELIFGNMFSSSNYDDGEKRTWGGTNGIGAKAANIFSEEFIIEIVCNGKKYVQTFSNGMKDKTVPTITKTKVKDYTKITFKPDFKAFGIKSFKNNDNMAVIEKRVYDASATTGNKVNVYYNGTKIPFKTFKDYVELYIGKAKKVIHTQDRWEVAFAMNPFETATQISFVNGIFTEEGGTHVNHVMSVIPKIIKEFESKAKREGISIKPQYVKDNLIVFVKCLIENPDFPGQLKSKLANKSSDFGSKCVFPDDTIKKISKLGIVDSIIELAKAKDLKIFEKKSRGTKKVRISDIPKLDDANKAGTRESMKCTLILTEGDSAKGAAMAMLSKKDKDYWGIFPLKGKLLNIRTASIKQLNGNAEIININRILGLSHDMKDKSKLRYGNVMAFCDQDSDGFHIKGLLMNYFTFYWPDIVEKNFLSSLRTPVVKVNVARSGATEKIKNFYNTYEFDEWKEENQDKRYKIKYYKGLGTNTDKEMKGYFKNLENNKVKYTYKKTKNLNNPSKDDKKLELVFDKTKADDRKVWILKQLKKLNDEGTLVDNTKKEYSINSFLNNELVMFSIYDNVRSLPNVIDGLKVSQRKVIYGSFLKKIFNKDKEIKVANLGSSVSENTDYHHGEKSLHDTITNMAQDYLGSGNSKIFFPSGNFGSRVLGGDDAASPRYIFTYFKKWVPTVFNKSDEALLKSQEDDSGNQIEPVNYAPIVPILLINGSNGIGTGWSCTVPCFNPEDIVKNIRKLLVGKDLKRMSPWYKGFKGSIVEVGENKWVSKGVYTLSGNILTITELPIGLWTETFKEKVLNRLEIDGKIKSYDDYTTKKNIHYIIRLDGEVKDIVKTFKLESSINATNMVAFDEDGQIKHYENAEEIMKTFFKYRLKFYKKRKDYLEKILEEELFYVSEKARFIKLVINEDIVVFRKKKKVVEEILVKNRFKKLSSNFGSAYSGSPSEVSFNYLTKIQINQFFEEKVDELNNKVGELKDELKKLKNKTPRHLWTDDLDTLEKFDDFWK